MIIGYDSGVIKKWNTSKFDNKKNRNVPPKIWFNELNDSVEEMAMIENVNNMKDKILIVLLKTKKCICLIDFKE